MPSKRKYDSVVELPASEGGDCHLPRKKRTRFQQRQTCERQPAKTNRARRSRGFKQRSRKSSAAENRNANMLAELADLADYNAAPISRRQNNDDDGDNDDEEEEASQPPPRRKREQRSVKDSRIKKTALKPRSKPKARSRKTRTEAEQIAIEAAALVPSPDWVPEAQNSTSDEDSDGGSSDGNIRPPRSLSRKYPPKQPGVQNVSWTEISPELRNMIYAYCMTNEEEKILNVVRYPDGVPRRSARGTTASTNFAYSYWGFTQTCKQVRNEFTPWLLEKRHVRTSLATLNKYIETFHRPHPVTGERTGHIELFCTQAPLTNGGVDIANLLKLEESNDKLHLQFSPTYVSPDIWVLRKADPDHYNELSIMEAISEYHKSTPQHAFADGLITGIRISSIEQAGPTDEEEDPRHEILLNLDVQDYSADKKAWKNCVRRLRSWLFKSGLAQRVGVKVKASFAGGTARMAVRRHNVVDLIWRKSIKDPTRIGRRFSYDRRQNAIVEEPL
ncbi:hypothetical protein FB567DRAFT_609987 [Paraphoma chrysanthemicola]|uniref:Uncharacterized protein n=1 Tax=Paraphoma chrysanthemicola TaxID=798071 RepID=A0A8K0REL6_9PLEO|nr:hypothetical protein FB567DRAFT_609987 [Paraphoma chrysanthemicola]